MAEKLLDYPLTESKADIVDGLRETPVDVNTEPKSGLTNTITVNEVKELIDKGVKSGSLTPEQVIALIRPLLGTKIKCGYYILSGEDTSSFIYYGNEGVPEDYTGASFYVGDNGYCYMEERRNGEVFYFLEISPRGLISTKDNNESATFNADGVNKLDFASLTHSFNELDETLRYIVEGALHGQAQSFTLAQWNVVKKLLDKSLYFYHEGYTMIKIGSYSDEDIQTVNFSSAINNTGAELSLSYDASTSELSGFFI